MVMQTHSRCVVMLNVLRARARRTIGLLLVVIVGLSGCVHPPHDPENTSNVDQSREAAEKALEDLEDAPNATEDLTIPGLNSTETGRIPDIIDDDSVRQPGSTPIGEAGWIEVRTDRMFPNSIAPDDAYHETLQQLRSEAVSKQVGAKIDVSSLLTDVMSQSGVDAEEETIWSGFFRSTVSGLIVEEQVREKTIVQVPEKNGYEMTVAIRTFVVPVRGVRDPALRIEAALVENLLHKGEELMISIKPSMDCYVYAFNLLSNHYAAILFPNTIMPDNYFRANQLRLIPDPESEISFPVSPLPGKKLSSEFIYLVCTKQPVPLSKDLPEVAIFGENIKWDTDSFSRLQKWLVEIPLSQRTEVVLNYHISQQPRPH